jgi:hypothetical protein
MYVQKYIVEYKSVQRIAAIHHVFLVQILSIFYYFLITM